MDLWHIAFWWIAASYVLGIVVVAEQLRRPLSEWQAAGRDRRFWVALTFVLGFHGLGQYATAAYLLGVVPRLRAAAQARRLPAVPGRGEAIVRRWQRAGRAAPTPRPLTAQQELVLVAALLVFASSFIHSAVIASHFEELWLIGAFFAIATCLQAVWTVLIISDPLDARLLVAGAALNAALIAVWTFTRTVSVPVGPQAGRPEAVGEIDGLSTADELVAVVLIGLVLASLRRGRPEISAMHCRLAAATAGPLFIYSVLAVFGGGHSH